MTGRHVERRDIDRAWSGWPVPEMVGGAVVGGIVGLSAVTVIPYLAPFVPSVAGVVAGALVGAILSWVWRPQRVATRHLRRIEEEPQQLRRAA